ncbi:MAG TPA: hypothetical protein VH878_00410 [Thermodesulfobacteriota bacterium]|jgi:hypothetical protein
MEIKNLEEEKNLPSLLETKTRVFIIDTFLKKGGEKLDGNKKESR